MIKLANIDNGYGKGIVLIDEEQQKSLSFIYGGALDYYIIGQIYPQGQFEEDKTLKFIIDCSNPEFFVVFNNFFKEVKDMVLKLKAGQRKFYLPIYKKGINCYNEFDTNQLFNLEEDRISWLSEAGSGPNKDTVMEIIKNGNEFEIIFKNEELANYAERRDRNVCICNSGSRSFVFHYFFWEFFQTLKELETKLLSPEVAVQVLKINNNPK